MKMSFDVDIPDWVKWIAQDSDGEWYGYSIKPSPSDDGWGIHGQMIQLAHGPEPKDFTKELYEIIR